MRNINTSAYKFKLFDNEPNKDNEYNNIILNVPMPPRPPPLLIRQYAILE